MFFSNQKQSKSDNNKVENKSERKEEDKAKEAINANESTIDLLKKLLSVMQMFTLTQLGCGPRQNAFEKNTLKKATHHWGDIRANLELSINKVLRIHDNLVVAKYKLNQLKLNSTNATTESDEEVRRLFIFNRPNPTQIHNKSLSTKNYLS